MTAPLVSIGIPTYNRRDSVLRAARSALAQDHPRVEVVVSDDASSDGTEEALRALAAEDPRLRVLRQSRNLGHAGNFQAVLDAASGERFMWLADDDWLDPPYVSRCVAELDGRPGTALVCGLGRYHRDGAHVIDERPIELRSRRPGLRVLAYFARVNVNGPLYGVAPRAEHARIGFPHVLGGDWLLVAAHAARGQVRTLTDVHVHRSLTGLSSDAPKLARGFGLDGFFARQPHVWVARNLLREIGARHPAFAGLGRRPRRVTAVGVAGLVLLRFTLLGLVSRALAATGLGRVEDAVIRLVRARDARRARS